MIIDTACEGCVFVKMDGDSQEGCLAGALDGFRSKNTPIKDQTIDGERTLIICGRVCMHRRLSDWVPNFSLTEKTTLVKDEVIPPITFIVFHTSTLERLRQTLSSIKHVDKFNKVSIVITYYTKNRQELVSLVEDLRITECVTFVSILDKDVSYIQEAFRVTKNGYLITVTSGFTVPSDVILKLNHALNNKMERVMVVSPVDSQNNLRTIMCTIAKALKIDTLYSIEEKIEELQKEQGLTEKLIFTWGDIDEYYTDI